MHFRTGRFCLALALIAAYGTVPLFVGHGLALVGMQLLDASLGGCLGWVGIAALLIGAFRRSEVWSIVGPLLLSASIWLAFAQVHLDRLYHADSIGSSLFWSGLFHVLLVVSTLRALSAMRDARHVQ